MAPDEILSRLLNNGGLDGQLQAIQKDNDRQILYLLDKL